MKENLLSDLFAKKIAGTSIYNHENGRKLFKYTTGFEHILSLLFNSTTANFVAGQNL